MKFEHKTPEGEGLKFPTEMVEQANLYLNYVDKKGRTVRRPFTRNIEDDKKEFIKFKPLPTRWMRFKWWFKKHPGRLACKLGIHDCVMTGMNVGADPYTASNFISPQSTWGHCVRPDCTYTYQWDN